MYMYFNKTSCSNFQSCRLYRDMQGRVGGSGDCKSAMPRKRAFRGSVFLVITETPNSSSWHSFLLLFETYLASGTPHTTTIQPLVEIIITSDIYLRIKPSTQMRITIILILLAAIAIATNPLPTTDSVVKPSSTGSFTLEAFTFEDPYINTSPIKPYPSYPIAAPRSPTHANTLGSAAASPILARDHGHPDPGDPCGKCRCDYHQGWEACGCKCHRDDCADIDCTKCVCAQRIWEKCYCGTTKTGYEDEEGSYGLD